MPCKPVLVIVDRRSASAYGQPTKDQTGKEAMIPVGYGAIANCAEGETAQGIASECSGGLKPLPSCRPKKLAQEC